MNILIYTLIALAIVAVLYLVFFRKEEEVEEEDIVVNESYAPRVIRSKDRNGVVRIYSAKLKSGRIGDSIDDYDFFDDFGSPILEELIIQMLFEGLESGEVGYDETWESAPEPEFDPVATEEQAAISEEYYEASEPDHVALEETVQERETVVEETYEAPEVESVSSCSSCSSDDSSSSSASSCSSSSSCSSGSSCGSSCGGD